MSLEALAFIAATLKFLAVPAAAIELLRQENRQSIEDWLAGTLPKLVKGNAITVLVLYLMLVLLVGLGPWLVILYMLFGRLTHAFFMSVEGIVTTYIFGIVVFIAAALEKWLIPESMMLAISLPYETFSTWANQHWIVDWLLPDFAAEEFLANYRDVFAGIEDWLWDWFAWLYGLYFFVTRGLLLILIIAIQLALLLAVILSAFLILLAPLHFIMLLSESVKRRMNFEAFGRLPVGAFLVFAAGETLDFVLTAIQITD